MTRNILIAIGGILLSVLLILLSGWYALNFTTMGKIAQESAALGHMMEYKDVTAKYGDPFKSMETGLRIIEYCIFPAGSILIGIYVGFLAKKVEVIVSAVTIFHF